MRFLFAKIEGGGTMESDWHWKRSANRNLKEKNQLKKKEGINYGIWKIWWTICATKLKRKIK